MAASTHLSIKATLRQGAPLPPSEAAGSVTGTLVGLSPAAASAAVLPVDLGETVDAAASGAYSVGAPSVGIPGSVSATTAGRTTVLPRRGAAGPAVSDERQRFEHVRVLGEGGMGFVELARDNDIRRTVAVKRMHGEAATADALMRFADEVRIVGQLEHP
ncbi:MAG: hypothetical protein ACRENE_07960, partial [Polyangiaceae bacterium]